jgi:hypothetical protein
MTPWPILQAEAARKKHIWIATDQSRETADRPVFVVAYKCQHMERGSPLPPFVEKVALRVSREKVGTGFSQKRCDNRQLAQDVASE